MNNIKSTVTSLSIIILSSLPASAHEFTYDNNGRLTSLECYRNFRTKISYHKDEKIPVEITTYQHDTAYPTKLRTHKNKLTFTFRNSDRTSIKSIIACEKDKCVWEKDPQEQNKPIPLSEVQYLFPQLIESLCWSLPDTKEGQQLFETYCTHQETHEPMYKDLSR